MALAAFARERGLELTEKLGRALRTMAMPGGYLGRRKDPPPGNEILWEGYTRLAISAQAYLRLQKLCPELRLHHLLSAWAKRGYLLYDQ